MAKKSVYSASFPLYAAKVSVMVMLLALARFSFVVVLAVLFFNFFGYPALVRYLEKAVLIKVSTISPPAEREGLLPPAITFCPMTPARPYPMGWKNSSSDDLTHVIDANCENLVDHKDVLKCIQEKTYQLNETLLDAFDGMKDPKTLLNLTYWTSYMTVTVFGNCYTLKYQQYFSADFELHSIWLYFHPDLVYDVYFHDPNYFLITNNLAFPQARIRKTRNTQTDLDFDFLPIVVTERRNINRPEQPCEEDLDYDFMSCVMNSVVAKVGCRFPWDETSHHKFPVCESLEKIRDQEEQFFTIGKLEKKDVVTTSGCQAPCRFLEYKILNDLMKGLTVGFGIGMMFPSTEITLEEEEYVYPFVSFVAEFGGALGMFLGFSFLMVWDFLYFGIITLCKYLK